MQNSSIPPKFSIPWANSAPAGNVRAIPTASQLSIQSGAASLTDGFPPLNFVPVAAGGVPPFGQDMNGILNQVTRWLQWNAAGGPTVYDGAFSTAVGGYPLGAQVLSNSLNVTYESIVNNNLQDPNAGSTQWRVASSVYSGAAWQATGSSNIQVLTLAPPPSALSNLVGIPLWIRSSGTNTGAVTLNVNNLGAVSVVAPGSIPLGAGSLVTNATFQVVYDGSVFVRISGTNVYSDPSIAGLTVTSGPNGANILLAGNGSTTPNKYIRANNGTFQIVNDAYTGAVVTVTDAGALSATGDITSGGRIRASLGATGTTDTTAVTIVSDFSLFKGNPGSAGFEWIYQKLPSGFVIQAHGGTSVTGADFITFPAAFPTKCVQVICNEGAPQGWITNNPGTTFGTIFGTQQISAANFALYTNSNVNGAWGLAGGVSFRYLAVGY